MLTMTQGSCLPIVVIGSRADTSPGGPRLHRRRMRRSAWREVGAGDRLSAPSARSGRVSCRLSYVWASAGGGAVRPLPADLDCEDERQQEVEQGERQRRAEVVGVPVELGA